MATVRKARERITEADFGSKATQRSMAPKARNKLLGVAFVVFVAGAVIAVAFALMTPSDERLVAEYISRTQMRAIYLQGFVALIDALISAAIVLHVILGIVQASLDVFLEAAAVKLSQAIFFSSMQTANPTSLRLAFVFVLIMLRVAAATLVFRVGWLSGVLTSAPSRHMPKVITSLLASGGSAPLGKDGTEHTAALSSMERPLTIELIERLMVWLVPFRERTAAVGLGRRQLIVIASFVLLMSGCALALPRSLRAARRAATPHLSRPPLSSISHPSHPLPPSLPPPPSYTAFSEYWSILGDQDELFEEPQKTAILGRSFECAAQFPRLRNSRRNSGAIPARAILLTAPSPSYRYLTSDWKSLRREGDVASRELLPSTPLSEASAAAGRVVVVVLSGLRLDALTKHAGLKGWVDGEVAAQRVGSGMNCTLRTTTPSLSLPAWVALLTGVQPEVHGLLGNRGPPELTYSSLLSLTSELNVSAVSVGTPWFVDLVRSKVAPLQVTRRHHHRHHHPLLLHHHRLHLTSTSPPPLPPSCRATDPSRPHTRSSRRSRPTPTPPTAAARTRSWRRSTATRGSYWRNSRRSTRRATSTASSSVAIRTTKRSRTRSPSIPRSRSCRKRSLGSTRDPTCPPRCSCCLTTATSTAAAPAAPPRRSATSPSSRGGRGRGGRRSRGTSCARRRLGWSTWLRRSPRSLGSPCRATPKGGCCSTSSCTIRRR